MPKPVVLDRDDIKALLKLNETACETLDPRGPDDEPYPETSLTLVRHTMVATATWDDSGNVQIRVGNVQIRVEAK